MGHSSLGMNLKKYNFLRIKICYIGVDSSSGTASESDFRGCDFDPDWNHSVPSVSLLVASVHLLDQEARYVTGTAVGVSLGMLLMKLRWLKIV